MTYTAYWYRFSHGKETDPMQAQWKDFDDLEKAIQFIRRKGEIIRGIYWAGAHVEDELGNFIFEITLDGSEYMSNNDDVVDDNENMSNNDVPEAEEKTSEKPTTFEEATKTYIEYLGKVPSIREFEKLYKTYRRCWGAFENFKEYLTFATGTERK